MPALTQSRPRPRPPWPYVSRLVQNRPDLPPREKRNKRNKEPRNRSSHGQGDNVENSEERPDRLDCDDCGKFAQIVVTNLIDREVDILCWPCMMVRAMNVAVQMGQLPEGDNIDASRV